jgi:NTE family protein
MSMSVATHPVDLVFEGGGVKGIGLAGSLSVLEERGFAPQNIAGTSAGAITAALLAAGYRGDELRDIVMDLDFRQFQDRAWEDKIPLIEKSLSLLLDLGIYEGERFYNWMKEQLAAKGVHTFGDLVREGDEQDPRWRYDLQVVASDVTKHRLLVLPRDAGELGIEPDSLEVALAVRMSMSIPIFFEPVRFDNPKTGEAHVIVDGGMLSNFPVWLFDCDTAEPPEWPTFGLLLVEPKPMVPIEKRLPEPEHIANGPRGLLAYVKSLAQTMMEAHDRLYVQAADYARTIPIPTLGVGTTEFNMSRERKLALYDSGRSAAEDFLKTWDFDAYIAAFRSGREHSRRKALTAEIAKEGAGVV